jgi:hypothetical protein
MMPVVTDKPLTISEMARLGGKARAKKMTAEERKESARNAVNARWEKQRKELREGMQETKKLIRDGQRRMKSFQAKSAKDNKKIAELLKKAKA